MAPLPPPPPPPQRHQVERSLLNGASTTLLPRRILPRDSGISLSSSPIGSGFRTAIGVGVMFIVIALVGLIVMLYFYVRYWREGERAHLGPMAQYGSNLEKTSSPDVSVASPTVDPRTRRAPPPPPLDLVVVETPPMSETGSFAGTAASVASARTKTLEKPKGWIDRSRQRLAPEPPEEWRNSGASVDVPPTPSRDLV